MICHKSPNTKCGFPSCKSCDPILTTVQPIADAEFRARFRFSYLEYNLQNYEVVILSKFVHIKFFKFQKLQEIMH